ncbi:hypothetical protein COLO4_17517 [Corchorus olitorius]|uniref:Uncharacterized protein n=1 Tax=Corchorus olitorius TaxID=93759 RepID=A0A1R3JCL4_9ROSI|nr:hypothetical protein COLO4_17517 [Corchorus olitorius]
MGVLISQKEHAYMISQMIKVDDIDISPETITDTDRSACETIFPAFGDEVKGREACHAIASVSTIQFSFYPCRGAMYQAKVGVFNDGCRPQGMRYFMKESDFFAAEDEPTIVDTARWNVFTSQCGFPDVNTMYPMLNLKTAPHPYPTAANFQSNTPASSSSDFDGGVCVLGPRSHPLDNGYPHNFGLPM